MLNEKNGVFVDVLSHADLVTCSFNPSGRTVDLSSLYPDIYPAKKIGQFRTDLGRRQLA